MQDDRYRRDVQGLRAIAVIAVVLSHASRKLPGGFLGVDIFFVISGFVIGGMLAHERETTGTVSFSRFYARRARRLLPAFSLVAVCTLIASIVLLSPAGAQQRAAKTAVAAAAFGTNVYQYVFLMPYFNSGRTNPFLHTWSLSLEEQIYLVLPLFLAGLWWISKRTQHPRRPVLAGIVAVTAVSLALCLALSVFPQSVPIPSPRRFSFSLPFTRFWEFGAGLLVACAPARNQARRRLAMGASALGAVCVAFSLALSKPGPNFPGLGTLVPVVGTALLIRYADKGLPLTRILSHRVPVWLGDRSYEWYLWHYPFVVLLAVTFGERFLVGPVAVAVSLWAAHVTHDRLSQPIRHNQSIVGTRALRLAVVCTVPVVAAAVVLHEGADRGWGVASLHEVQQTQQRSDAEQRGCDSTLRRSGCIITTGPEGLLVLVGDSHAGAISDIVRADADDARMGFGTWTRSSCAFLVDSSISPGDGCATWSREVMSWLRAVHPRVVVIHISTDALTKAGRVRDANGRPIADNGTAVARLVAGIVDTATRIQQFGARVMVVEDTPQFRQSRISRATLLHPHVRPATRQRAEVLADHADLRREVARQFAPHDIVFVPTLEGICPVDPCTDRTSVWLYRDSHHVTDAGARMALAKFPQLLASVLAG